LSRVADDGRHIGAHFESAATSALSDRRSQTEERRCDQDFAISYVTHGTLNAKKSNAVLMVTAISGNHHRLDFSSGPAKRWTPTNSSSFAPTRLEMD
jgi:homoserine acetyltransferase